MEKTLTICLVLLNCLCYSQQITFSKQIIRAKDSSIIKIKETWNSYLNDCVQGTLTGNTDYVKTYWNKTEFDAKRFDIVKDNISSQFPVYLFGDIYTFDISKTDSNLYKLKSMIISTDSMYNDVLNIFSIYAKLEGANVKFYNYFFFQKQRLSNFQSKNIDFYYPDNYQFNKKGAKQVEDFYQTMASQAAYFPENKLVYLLAENLEEANKLLGFRFYGSNR